MDLGGDDAFEQVGSHGEEALLEPGRAGVRASGGLEHPVQLGGGVLERLALEEASKQQVALLVQHQLLVYVDVVTTGQQPGRLELDECGGDQQELRRDLEVARVQALHLGEESVDDGVQRHLVEVDLLLQDQVEQKVEGPLEDGRLHRERHRSEDRA